MLNLIKNKDLRILWIFIAMIILSGFIINFYKTTRNVSDENLFINVHSKIYINKDIISSVLYQGSSNITENNDESGHLVININSSKRSDTIIFQMYNPQKQLFYEMSVLKDNFSKNDTSRIERGGALITSVQKDGASERAGLKTGDIIVAINDKNFDDVIGADRIMRQFKAGSMVKYTVIRKGTLMNFYPKLARFGIPFMLLEMTLYGIICVALALFVGITRPKPTSSKFITATFLIMSFIFISLPQINILAGIWVQIAERILYEFVKLLLIPLLFHTFAHFPFENKKLLSKKWTLAIPYIMTAIFFIFVVINYLTAGTYSIYVLYTSIAYSALLFLYILTTYIIFTPRGASPKRSTSVLILITVLFFPLMFFTGGLTRYFLLTSGSGILLLDKIQFILTNAIVAIPIIWFFVIRRSNQFNYHFRIKRYTLFYFSSIVWQLAIAVIIVLAIWLLSSLTFYLPQLTITGSTIEILDTPSDFYNTQKMDKIIFVLISFLIAAALWKINSMVQKKLSTKFYRTKFDYKKASTELSQLLSQNMTLSQLSENISSELMNLLYIKRLGMLIFRDEEKLAEQAYIGFKSDGLSEICKATGYRLIESIKEIKSEFPVTKLPEPIKSVFEEFEIKYIIPIISKRRINGALLMGEKMSEGTYSNEDFNFLTSIAGQIAISIDNGFLVEDLSKRERIKHELDIARRIQLASLPQSTPKSEELDISGISLPALEVGGDFYDYLENDGTSITVVVGDVSGKGTSAALYMSKVQGIIRTLHEFELQPRKLLVSSNQLMSKYLESSYFITAFVAQFITSEKRIIYSRAGHLPLYYFNSQQQSVNRLVSKGILLGYSKESLFERNLEEIDMNYTTGDVFVFVTDGVVEARNYNNQEFGEDRLLKTVQSSCSESAENIRNSILDAVRVFSADTEQYDDLTVVVVKII